MHNPLTFFIYWFSIYFQTTSKQCILPQIYFIIVTTAITVRTPEVCLALTTSSFIWVVFFFNFHHLVFPGFGVIIYCLLLCHLYWQQIRISPLLWISLQVYREAYAYLILLMSVHQYYSVAHRMYLIQREYTLIYFEDLKKSIVSFTADELGSRAGVFMGIFHNYVYALLFTHVQHVVIVENEHQYVELKYE